MRTKFYFVAALAATMLASCADDKFVGDNSPNVVQNESAENAINFGFDFPNITRGNIGGKAAADLLGNNFYVTGTKGTEAATYPTSTLVFDNYLVHYGANTAGTTESNTANWEYVGIDQATGVMTPADYKRVKLSSINGAQTIKYWDYSVPQYDFLAFSTGNFAAVKGNSTATTNIGVTAMKYGAGLDVESTVPTAYTFDLPSVDALKETYITDITEVAKANYGKEVTLRFKNLGSKVRVALYETVPGYSVKDVKFYSVEGAAPPTDLGNGTGDNAVLISPSVAIPTAGSIAVMFPHVGVNHSPEATGTNTRKADYDKASVTVTPKGTNAGNQAFGELTSQLVGNDRDEVKWDATEKKYIAETGNVFLGRDFPHATFAGLSAAKFYKTMFPVSTSAPLVLRVDYTLVPIDGAHETITVNGAKAVVPSTYTVWQPNYAYTYVFKISDNTNGWTSTDAEHDPAGLFPITFDAVVAEATDANAEQTTITTVATPTITTYQQNHNSNTNGDWVPLATNEYSIATAKDIYVQVMDNSTAPATLIGNLNDPVPGESGKRSILYAVTGSIPITEATVMDALENRSSDISGTIVGRNALTLTKDNDNIDASVKSIVNGPDDNPITKIAGTPISAGQVAKIAITASGFATGTYAYVYDYSTGAKTPITEFQPLDVSGGTVGVSGKSYLTLTTGELNTLSKTSSNFTTDDPSDPNDQKVDNDYIYFSMTTNGTNVTTYSYISVTGKKDLPAGLLKVEKSTITTPTSGGAAAVDGNFYFETYITNDGSYAVKVIKVVS